MPGRSSVALAGAGGDDPIFERHADYAAQVATQLKAVGVAWRSTPATKDEREIRDTPMQKVPFLLVVGDKEPRRARERRTRGKEKTKTWVRPIRGKDHELIADKSPGL